MVAQGEELVLGEHAGGDVAEDDGVVAGPFFGRFGQAGDLDLAFLEVSVLRGEDEVGGEDGAFAQEEVLEVALFPARAAVDEEDAHGLVDEADGDGLGVVGFDEVGRVGYEFDGPDGVAGVGGSVGEGDGLRLGADLDAALGEGDSGAGVAEAERCAGGRGVVVGAEAFELNGDGREVAHEGDAGPLGGADGEVAPRVGIAEWEGEDGDAVGLELSEDSAGGFVDGASIGEEDDAGERAGRGAPERLFERGADRGATPGGVAEVDAGDGRGAWGGSVVGWLGRVVAGGAQVEGAGVEAEPDDLARFGERAERGPVGADGVAELLLARDAVAGGRGGVFDGEGFGAVGQDEHPVALGVQAFGRRAADRHDERDEWREGARAASSEPVAPVTTRESAATTSASPRQGRSKENSAPSRGEGVEVGEACEFVHGAASVRWKRDAGPARG